VLSTLGDEHGRAQLTINPDFTHLPLGKRFSSGLKSDNACVC
jgi:hypothetical protein